jgi:hypothetical protein
MAQVGNPNCFRTVIHGFHSATRLPLPPLHQD